MEGRSPFWRSKPVGVKTFIAIKYLVGLFIAFVVIAFPFLFSIVSCSIVKNAEIELGFYQLIANSLFISLLTYSLCFFCNTLVRKTARAWLIGMAMTVFLLLLPFILPLNLTEIREVIIAASAIYLSVTLATSLIAFFMFGDNMSRTGWPSVSLR